MLGISWGCDWGYKENGVYWEECYCAEDACNGALPMKVHFPAFAAISFIFTLFISKYITC